MMIRDMTHWATLALSAVLLLAGSNNAVAQDDESQEQLSLYDRLGGLAPISVVVSDFIADDFEPALRIACKRHDLIPVTITDPRELNMPNVGFVTLEDPETEEVTLVDTANRRWRKRYTSLVRRRLEARKAMFRRMDTATLDVRTDQSYLGPLILFFHKREMRR